MKPVAILRFSPVEGPGYFADFLTARGIAWQLLAIDAGEAVPTDSRAFSGLCLMGGPMSVNDPLPWIEPVLSLIRAADAAGVPVIGHCLGGQLMSKAWGGQVQPNAVKEIGWSEVQVMAPEAHAWFGPHERFTVFQWHGETFSVPPGAVWLATNPHCRHQAFARGPHLAMQFHIEMTEPLLRAWCADWAKEKAAPGPSVQTPAEILAPGLQGRLAALQAVADRVYQRWIEALPRV